MRVFSVEMLVKEEGAAVVEAALKRLKGETAAVAAQMKTTTSQVTSTGKAMRDAATGTQIAGDRAAKAAIGFAAVGQSIARTGTLTADAGTRIIEAGSQIATMFGPRGLVVAAMLSGFVALKLKIEDARKEIEKLKESFDELADVGNVESLRKELAELTIGRPSQNYQDGIIALATELAKLKDKYQGVVFGLDDLTRASRVQLLMNADLSAQEKEDLIRIGELNTQLREKNELVARINQLLPIASSVQSANTDTTKAAADALKAYNEELEQAVKRNMEVRGAIQAREAATTGRAPSLIGQTQFGTGLEASAAKPRGLPKDLVISVPKPIVELPEAVDIDQQLLKAIRVDEIKNTLSDGISEAVEGGLTSGLEMALSGGNIGDSFKAMGQAIVRAMASAMVRVAMEAIKLGSMLDRIREFMILHPKTAVITAVALLALARSMGGSATASSMTAIGGPGGLSYSPMGASAPSQQIVFGSTSATSAAGMTPRQAMNVTIIGPNDPSAQRAMQELMAKADSRGRLG